MIKNKYLQYITDPIIANVMSPIRKLSIWTNPFLDKELEEDLPQPPSPVSSSYSELRRASDVFSKAVDLQEKIPNKPMATSMSRANHTNQYATQNVNSHIIIYHQIIIIQQSCNIYFRAFKIRRVANI